MPANHGAGRLCAGPDCGPELGVGVEVNLSRDPMGPSGQLQLVGSRLLNHIQLLAQYGRDHGPFWSRVLDDFTASE